MTETVAPNGSARVPPPASDEPVRRSPAGAMHAELGADLVLEAGWEIVRSYGDPDKERSFLNSGIAIADVTARAKIDVRGNTVACEPLASDGDVVARMSPEWALLVSRPGTVTERVTSLQNRAGTAAMVTDVTHLYAGFALCGPQLPELLARVTGWNHGGLTPGGSAGAPIADVRAVVVRRELAIPVIEAFVSAEFGRHVWATLLGVVRSLGGGPAGWEALRGEGWF